MKLSAQLGTVPCILHGPAMGDPPVANRDVTRRRRGNREWHSRTVDRPIRQVDTVTIIAGIYAGAMTLFTIYGGPLCPQEPDDPNCQDVDASTKFWNDHALSHVPVEA